MDSGSDDLLASFMGITGVTDATIATSFLEMGAFDVQTAANLYFMHNTSSPKKSPMKRSNSKSK